MYPRARDQCVEEGLEIADLTDDSEELLPENFGEVRPKTRTCSRSRLLVGAMGGVALVVCGLLAASSGNSVSSPSVSASAPTVHPPSLSSSARMLLESPELVDAATEQLLKTGQSFLTPEKHAAVRSLVAKGYSNLTAYIAKHHSAAFEQLNQIQITHEQKQALLHQVRMFADPRVQSIGQDVARAFNEGHSQGREAVKQRVMDKMKPRFGELRNLQEEFMPPALGGSHHDSSQFDIKLEIDGMRVMKSFDAGAGSMEMDMSRPETGSARRLNTQQALLSTEQSFGLINGIIEQARIVLDQIQLVGSTFNSPIAHVIPAWSRSLVGLLDVGSGLVTCMIDGMGNPSLQIMCPMRYASAAMDVFASLTYLLGGGTHTATTTGFGVTTSNQLWPW